MKYKLKKENHDFWVERLKTKPERQVCTNDVAFDDVEDNVVSLNEREGNWQSGPSNLAIWQIAENLAKSMLKTRFYLIFEKKS